jgi:Putative Flp pilus-assembly TadE/G-like
MTNATQTQSGQKRRRHAALGLPRRRQNGAVIITTMLTLLALLGFMGIATDFGHLFVVKTELQTAADSCALAAAQELDGGSDALVRATRAGKTAGNLNKVNFQGGGAGLVDADVIFSDVLNGAYSQTFTPVANAKYAKCTSTKGGMAPWLLQALTAVSGNTAFAANQGVLALGVATRTSAQTACAIPVQIRPKAGGTAPNYGYTPGEWIPSLYDETGGGPPAAITPGHFGWANLDGSTNATETKRELLSNGFCNLKVGDNIGTSGAKFGASEAWNSRFGLYKNGAGNPDITTAAPDTTGYSYTAINWPSQSNAVGNFLAKRADFRSYGDLVDTVNNGNTITGLNVSNAYNPSNMGTHAAGVHALATYGTSRRLVLAPIVASTTLSDWACVLMLHPIDKPTTTVYLEFVGNARAITSPCASAGKAGGTNGPLVPALVQ